MGLYSERAYFLGELIMITVMIFSELIAIFSFPGYEREKRAIISANRFVPISENATAIVR